MINKLRLRYMVLILAVVGLVLYLPGVGNSFVWDDEEQVVYNQSVHSMANIGSLFTGSTFNSGGGAQMGGVYYKPLMSASYTVLYSLYGADPAPFHVLQLLLHIGSGVLVMFLFYRILGRRDVALMLSMIFLVHPLNVEVVSYISSLQDTLYMLLGLSGLVWVVYSPKLRYYDYLTVSFLLLLAMLGKETGVLFFPIIFFYLMFYRTRSEAIKWVGWSALPLSVYSWLRFPVAGIYFDLNYFTPIAGLSIMERLRSLPLIVWHYLSTFFYPARLAISQHWVVGEVGMDNFYLPVLLMLAVMIWIVRYYNRTRSREFLFFCLILSTGLLLHLQIFPLDLTVADRWFYLPMIGVLGMMGSVMGKMSSEVREWIMAVLVIVLLLLLARSSVRIRNWRDGMTLYRHDVRVLPDSFDLNNNYGVELVRAGEYKLAKPYLVRSTEIAPSWWTNWNNLGVVMENEGELAEAGEYYLRAIENGQYYLAYANYGKILLKQKRTDEAIIFLRRSLQLLPGNVELQMLYEYAQSR